MGRGARSPGCSSSARRAAPTCGCSAPRTRPCACGCPGTGPTWAWLRCARPCDKEGSLADQATDTASAALLKEMADEMSHEIYLAGNHPMLGVDRVLVR